MIVSPRIFSNAGSEALPGLDEFQKAAEQGGAVVLERDGEKWQVKGQGAMPGSGRSVAWVRPVDGSSDTTSAFVQALGQGFSSGISRAVARELGLTPAPGQSLSSRTVRQAIDMAETAQQAMSGVDFFTALSCSAAKNGPAFQRACQDLGVTASSLDMQAREQIDRSMERRFQSATQAGQSPVSMAAAEAWLRQELESLR